jgi:peptidyl-prolyl cis-trans isomerase B (cyclophilin B)
MPTQRERELARARARRQAARRAASARRRRTLTYVVSGVLVLAIVGVIIGLAATGGGGGKGKNAAASASATPSASASATPSASSSATTARAVACGAKAPAPPTKQTYSKEPPMTIDTSAKYLMKIDTSCGEIDVTMDAAKTPHTVNSFAFLASKHFFDGIHFSRSVSASQGFAVLQGGDQSSDGSGGPGYNIPDENLKGAKYTRGTVAMANTGQPNSGGSQFFLIDQTTTALAASYTPFGTITKGLNVLDKLLAIGNDGSNQAGGGVPNQTIYINSLTVTKI